MQTSVADSTSAVANPTFNNLLHKTEIHLTTEREYSKLQTVDSFIMTGSKMVKESVHKIEKAVHYFLIFMVDTILCFPSQKDCFIWGICNEGVWRRSEWTLLVCSAELACAGCGDVFDHLAI